MKKILTTIFTLWSILAFAALERVDQSQHVIEYFFKIGDYQIADEGNFTILQYDEITEVGEEGSPRLPHVGLDFIVPQDGNVSVKISKVNSKKIHLNKPLLPNPTMVPSQETYRAEYLINHDIYNQKKGVLEVGELSRYRHYDYYPIDFSPFIYDYQNQELEIITEVRFEINILAEQYRGETVNDKFSSVYSAKFENYRTAQNYGVISKYESKALDFSSSDFWYKITADGSGIFALNEDLEMLPGFASADQLQFVKAVEESGSIIWLELPQKYVDNEPAGLDKSDNLYFENIGEGNTLWLKIDPETKAAQSDLSVAFAQEITKFSRKRFAEVERDNYDSIIIYPDENTFYSQAQNLADFYQQNYNLSSLLISQEDIFDSYTGGNETQSTGEVAVRDTLEACYNLYSNLEYVTLLGSGTSSWSSVSAKNKIITFLTPWGYVSDDQFVDFNPESHSYVPELAIGRLPAQNTTQMNEIISRMELYVENPASGLWRDKVMFIADDENKDGGYEGSPSGGPVGMNHSDVVEYLSEFIDNNVIMEKIFAFNYGFDQFQNKPGVRDEIAATLNEGCALWTYVGHGNPTKLGDEDYFSVTDLHYLQNRDNLAVFVGATCSAGKYDELNTDSISELMLYLPSGGSIASIAATEKTGPDFNINFMKKMLPKLVNETLSFGKALMETKVDLFASGQGSSSMSKYNLLGSPVLSLPIPPIVGSFNALEDSLQAREVVSVAGVIGSDGSDGTALLMVHDSYQQFNYSNFDHHYDGDEESYYSFDYVQEGNVFYRGDTSVNETNFSTEIIIPDDISDGDEGMMRIYYNDPISQQDYIAVVDDIDYSSIPLDVTDDTPPTISLKLDSELFQTGDYVSTSPLLMADIEDENGLNLLGVPGHSMLMLIDESNPVVVSSGFVYEENSARKGMLTWQLENLSEGNHLLQLIVFDNFNNFQVAETNFYAKGSGKIVINDLLFYPNPYDYSEAAKFTFVITENADVSVKIYTITGKKIATLTKPGCSSGYNEIIWNGKDGDGDNIANGNYFYKLRAKSGLSNYSAEKLGKLIILK